MKAEILHPTAIIRKSSKSNSGKQMIALNLCLAGGPIFYTGWAPPDFNVDKIAMYRRGVCPCEGLRECFELQPGMFQDCVEIL